MKMFFAHATVGGAVLVLAAIGIPGVGAATQPEEDRATGPGGYV